MWYSPPSYDIPGWEEGYCYTMLDGVTLTGMGVEGGGTLPSIGKAPINKGNTSRMRNKMNSEVTILNRTEIERLFLEPSEHFSHKRIGRLTIRRRDIEESWGRNILRKLKESGVKMTRNN